MKVQNLCLSDLDFEAVSHLSIGETGAGEVAFNTLLELRHSACTVQPFTW